MCADSASALVGSLAISVRFELHRLQRMFSKSTIKHLPWYADELAGNKWLLLAQNLAVVQKDCIRAQHMPQVSISCVLCNAERVNLGQWQSGWWG